MAIQYVDANADAVGTVGDTYNIGSTNDQFSIAVDGGSNQVITLTHGAARTATQVVADLSTLTSCTASVVTVNSVNLVRIRTTSANNASSTILFNAPSNNSNTILGFIATTYTGGTNVNTTFTGGTKQNIIDGIETALLSAGWITISGHTTTNLLMQSSMSPSTQNLRMRIRIKDNSNTCTVCSIENVFGTKTGSNSTTNGGQLLPAAAKTFRVIANKYQAFVFVPASTTAREFVGWGVPYLPSFLAGGTIYEAAWLSGNCTSDTGTTTAGSFRTCLGVWDHSSNLGNSQQLVNGTIWETANNSGSANIGYMSLITMFQGILMNNSTTASYYRWHDTSAFLTDPLIAWGVSAVSDEALVRGQLWDCFISTEAYAIDTTLSSIDSHNWWNLTSNNTGNGSATPIARGSVFVVAP
jgi:hypothetical protein